MGEYADYAVDQLTIFSTRKLKNHLKKTASKNSPKKDVKCKHCGAVVFWKDEGRNWALYWNDENKKLVRHQCTKKDKVCNTCGSKFMWKQIKENWIPHDLDGKIHICKPKELQDIPVITDAELEARFGNV